MHLRTGVEFAVLPAEQLGTVFWNQWFVLLLFFLEGEGFEL